MMTEGVIAWHSDNQDQGLHFILIDISVYFLLAIEIRILESLKDFILVDIKDIKHILYINKSPKNIEK